MIQCTVESESTDIQRETEEECSPFFVDLRTLPSEQLQHLRNVGLLPSAAAAEDAGNELRVIHTEIVGESDDDDNDDASATIEVLEEDSFDGDLRREANSYVNDDAFRIRLLKEKHTNYLNRALNYPLAPSYVSLDASRPWIIYWTLHSLDLLNALPEETVLTSIVKALESCWQEHTVKLDAIELSGDSVLEDELRDLAIKCGKIQLPAGGFGGNMHMMAHCAPTYAAINALSIVYSAGAAKSTKSSRMALDLLQSRRKRLYAWYLSLRCDVSYSGDNMTAYRMHHDGEIDVRATYTIFAAARLLKLESPLLMSPASADFVASCQTYEGGFGGEVHSEAHGGYTFCAIAALKLFEDANAALSGISKDINAKRVTVHKEDLRHWIVKRQMSYEGGFSGRANKLVDGCYSFWQGGSLAVLDSNSDSSIPGLCFDIEKLQRYVLLCAQDVNGGLRDKPSKPRDFYHTCYNLSGLSVTQHVLADAKENATVDPNIVGETHPVLNVRVERVRDMSDVNFSVLCKQSNLRNREGHDDEGCFDHTS